MGLEERGASVIVAGESWPPGVVGLIAARLKERFGRPAFALTLNGDDATGSARSIPGVDLGRGARAVETGLATKGGGHAMAAGVTLRASGSASSAPFSKRRCKSLSPRRDAMRPSWSTPRSPPRGDARLAQRLEAAGPFGSGNPEPVFALPRHRLADVMLVGADHVRLRAIAGDGQPSRRSPSAPRTSRSARAFAPSKAASRISPARWRVNRYGGREKAQLRVVDVAEALR